MAIQNNIRLPEDLLSDLGDLEIVVSAAIVDETLRVLREKFE